MIDASSLTNYLTALLPNMDDYGPNGLQVEGERGIQHLVTGVTASAAWLAAAIEAGADAVLVHHGLFWRGDAQPVVGMLAKRLRLVMQAGVHVYAYHLPLDVHPLYGNNTQLGQQFGWEIAGRFDCVGVPDGACWATLPEPMAASRLADHVGAVLDRPALCLPGGDHRIQRVAWCTGAAQDGVVQAAEQGMDAFVTGEASERTTHLANELGVHVFVAGHHATERYGVQAVGAHLAEHFTLQHTFIDSPNPI